MEGRDIDSHLIDLALKIRDSWYEEHYQLPEGQEKKNLLEIASFKTENFVAEATKKAPVAPALGEVRLPSVSSGGPRKSAAFDTVTCMSVTKWIHLNWGDEGILSAFKRFQQLVRVGGYLIVEIQDWQSYRKKKDMTKTTMENFKSLKLRPESFVQILTDRYYFKFIEEIVPANTISKGFARPISVFQRV